MLKKSLVLGALAAMAMAPAAFANQVQSNGSNTQINTGNYGVGNVNGVTSDTSNSQYQDKFKSPWCFGGGSQAQGNFSNTGIASTNIGAGNVNGVSSNTSNGQTQTGTCY